MLAQKPTFVGIDVGKHECFVAALGVNHVYKIKTPAKGIVNVSDTCRVWRKTVT